MKDWPSFILQFGLGGGALGILAFFGWMQFRHMANATKSSDRRWEELAKAFQTQNASLVEIVRQNSDHLQENNRVLAVVKDRL